MPATPLSGSLPTWKRAQEGRHPVRRFKLDARNRVEGYHGEAKTWHGLGRALRRGLKNIKIQAYLAAAVHLKRLAANFLLMLRSLLQLNNAHISITT